MDDTHTVRFRLHAPGGAKALVDSAMLYQEPDGTVILLLIKSELLEFAGTGFVNTNELADKEVPAQLIGAFSMSPNSLRAMAKNFSDFVAKMDSQTVKKKESKK